MGISIENIKDYMIEDVGAGSYIHSILKQAYKSAIDLADEMKDFVKILRDHARILEDHAEYFKKMEWREDEHSPTFNPILRESKFETYDEIIDKAKYINKWADSLEREYKLKRNSLISNVRPLIDKLDK